MFLTILGIYYLFVFIFVGWIGSISITSDYNIDSAFKTIFMYQYAIYEYNKDDLNIAGIIILEVLTTLSVWFLNVAIFLFVCVFYIWEWISDLFSWLFEKR